MWMELSRGQRRAVLVLLCVIMLLCVVQVITQCIKAQQSEMTADYSVLEQEITEFRSQLDTIPVENRPPTYLRRTHARPDSTHNTHVKFHRKKAKTKATPRTIDDTPRVDKR